MASIVLENASVTFPVFNAASRSFKNRIINIATGGTILQEHGGHMLVRGLNGITARIDDGERIGLIGHNGSGKTTLLRVLSSIYSPTSGKVEIQGECVSLININLGIDPEATGRENIRLRAMVMGMSPRELKKRYDEIADFSGLGDFLDMPFRTYSTGMQLRLAFATSTSISPEILIMDEWLSTGDQDFKERADRRLKEIVSSTKILVLASHSKELLLNNCERIIWLEHGKVRADGPADEIAKLYFG
ncbi:MAG: ABC transporter ATP-binding protein [Mesorhizobium sp.]|uniref:ABC transporter ATP-binding protein n=1 Tax=Mesorhizobium sp. TaxID=1871066 RepID=UPI0011FFEFFB|nr:ABC transporter ATP-binding protein [Mesorhizobium sp.]TIQ29123.1 MAG: ABC transporter ATP-binding protein [Mesorhizobium sp.]